MLDSSVRPQPDTIPDTPSPYTSPYVHFGAGILSQSGFRPQFQGWRHWLQKLASRITSSLSPRVRQADGLDVVGEPGGLSVLGDDPEEGDVVGDVVHAEPRVQQHLPHLEPLLVALLHPGVPHLRRQLQTQGCQWNGHSKAMPNVYTEKKIDRSSLQH